MTASMTVAWARAYWASGRPTQSRACAAATATSRARGSARPDVLRGEDDQPPGDEPRVLAGGDHRREPVQGRVGIVAADALDERADGVVVAVAGTVVGEGPLLGRGLHVLEPGRDTSVGVADALGLGDRDRALEDVEGLAGVAGGESDEMLERLVGKRDASGGPEVAGQAALRVGKGAPDDACATCIVGERLEPIDAQPRQERGVDLEVGVLGRGADRA